MESNNDIVWSYGYTIETSETSWAHRMDHYYKIQSSNIHWYQQIIAIGIVMILLVVVCFILRCGLKRDINAIKDQAL